MGMITRRTKGIKARVTRNDTVVATATLPVCPDLGNAHLDRRQRLRWNVTFELK